MASRLYGTSQDASLRWLYCAVAGSHWHVFREYMAADGRAGTMPEDGIHGLYEFIYQMIIWIHECINSYIWIDIYRFWILIWIHRCWILVWIHIYMDFEFTYLNSSIWIHIYEFITEIRKEFSILNSWYGIHKWDMPNEFVLMNSKIHKSDFCNEFL